MKSDQHRNFQEILVFLILVGIGVAGRRGQPEWCFTPTAAAAIFAGWYFSRWAIAALVPIAILAVSDLLLPAYNSVPVLITTYAVMTLPVWMGRMLRRPASPWKGAIRWALVGLLPATLFYIFTNFAVWAFQSDYEKSLTGLMHCYWAAVPFYRWMLCGDLFYLSVLVTCAIIAGVHSWSGDQVEGKTTVPNR